MGPAAVAEEQLEELGCRIDVLAAHTPAGTEETWPGLQRRLAALRSAADASAPGHVHEAAASVEENMLELEMRLNIAEQAAAVELAENKHEFLIALIGELHGWDVYLERLQVKIATTAGGVRRPGEEAIRQLRRHRQAVGAPLAGITSTAGAPWREVRKQVQAARRDLGSRVSELEAMLLERSERDAQRPIG